MDEEVEVFEALTDDVPVVEAVLVLDGFTLDVEVRVFLIVRVATLVFEIEVEELADFDGRVEAESVGLELLDLDGLELRVFVGEDVWVFDLAAVSVTLRVTKLDGDDRDDVEAVFEVSPDWVRAGVDDELLDCVPDLVEVIVDVIVFVDVEEVVYTFVP